MRKIDSFLLQKSEDYLEFCKFVRNIIDWGEGKWLKQIRDSLDALAEESRKRAERASGDEAVLAVG